MARKRPTASNDARSPLDVRPQPKSRELTRAEVHALRRSAPLTPEQFKALRLIAQRGGDPLRHV